MPNEKSAVKELLRAITRFLEVNKHGEKYSVEEYEYACVDLREVIAKIEGEIQ